MADRLRRHGNNAMKSAQAEEFGAARIAAIGMEPEQTPQQDEIAFVHAIAGDVLQVEIAALRAMRMPGIDGGDRPGIEAVFARAAPPGAQAEKGEEQVFRASPARPAAGFALTMRTQHGRPLKLVAEAYDKGAKGGKPVLRTGGPGRVE